MHINYIFSKIVMLIVNVSGLFLAKITLQPAGVALSGCTRIRNRKSMKNCDHSVTQKWFVTLKFF